MRDIPFNISMLVYTLYLGVMVAGAIFGAILKFMGFDGFWGIYLSAVLALPLANAIRYGLGKIFADQSGYTGPQPTAFNFPIRMAIGAVVAAPVALLTNVAVSSS